LWPHLTVAENVAYGLDVRAVPREEKRARVEEALRIVRMEGLAERSPNQLSGGQQQRVALARALVIRPDVLLLDEPLSNLDTRLRLEMRDEIRRIHDETRITTLYVTHDQKEALSMADRLAVMREGIIEQIGPPREVYRHPANRFVAEFIGEVNWLAGRIRDARTQPCEVETALGAVLVAGIVRSGLAGGATVDVGFRPEAVRLTDHGVNCFRGTVQSVHYLGEIEQYVLRLADGTLIKAFEQNPEAVRPVGATVQFHLPPSSVFVLPGASDSR
jgi:iron(III) transport system ATP-binding protein